MAVSRTAAPATPTRDDVVTAFRRESLLAAARRVFGARGFDAATVDAIAAEAQVAKGTVYLYFPSKEAIYDAAFDAGLDQLIRHTAERLRDAAGPRDAIRAFIEVRLEYFQEQPDFFRMYMVHVSRQIAGCAPSRGPDVMTLQTRALRDLFARAVRAGALRAVDPAAAAHAVFDMTRGLIARRLLSRTKSSVAADVAFLTDLLWTGLQPPASAVTDPTA